MDFEFGHWGGAKGLKENQTASNDVSCPIKSSAWVNKKQSCGGRELYYLFREDLFKSVAKNSYFINDKCV